MTPAGSGLAFDIQSLHQAYRDGLTPADMIAMVFDRIEAADDSGIFISLADRASLLAAAKALGPLDLAAKPLWGIPFAVKDNIDVAGLATTAACPAFAYRPERDAAVVARLKAAGALVIGKTNLDQFAAGLVGLRSPYPPPKNAVHPALVPGGSSSGSAVAVARGIVSFALGTDTAGSGRVPAGLNNIVGLKPTIGALSTTGVVPACRSIDCVSIFGLTVDDCMAAFNVAAAYDPANAWSRPVAIGPMNRPPVLSIGVPAKADREFFGDGAMQAGFDEALAMLQRLGCSIVELPFGDFYGAAKLLYEGAFVAERYAAIADFFDRNEDALHEVTRAIIGGARNLTAADTFRSLYALEEYRTRTAPLIASVDLLCVPTAPTHYTVDAVLADPIATNRRLGTYTNFVNLLDLCGIAVPTGTRRDGQPVSVTLLAPAGEDALAASLARDLHELSGLTLGATLWPQPSPLCPPPASDDGIDLVVVGAHLSGMPLNDQLTDLGARFVRATRTAPVYRLYALPGGGGVPRPGMLREANGVAIDVEVWRLSPAAFGRFVAAIPAPLGIGTIELTDSSATKGFLVEPSALKGAADISAYGGWRAYMLDTQATG